MRCQKSFGHTLVHQVNVAGGVRLFVVAENQPPVSDKISGLPHEISEIAASSRIEEWLRRNGELENRLSGHVSVRG